MLPWRRHLTLLLLLLLSGCGGLLGGDRPGTQKYQLHIDANLEFRIKIPPAWQLVKLPPEAPGYLPYSRWWKPAGMTGQEPELLVVAFPQEQLPPEPDALLERFRTAHPEFRPDPVRDQNLQALTGQEGDRRMLLRLLDSPRRRYLVVASAPTAGFEALAETLAATLDSFLPLPPDAAPR